MTDPHARMRAAFRLNLEQQKKRAKDLLKAARAGDSDAVSRFEQTEHEEGSSSPFQLADAQRVIARELGFDSWAQLKHHVAAMELARKSVEDGKAPDADRTTLHLRCGSDIRQTLLAAGFRGDFLEHSYPYAHGPVTTDADHFEREARFIAEFAGEDMSVTYDDALARRRREERELAQSAARHERIVLWMEHDCFDQLVLVRCLAHFASCEALPALELVQADRFPGSIRFIGLGQLPEEALRLLWARREPVSRAALDLAAAVWDALSRPDPRELAAHMRSGCEALPNLPRALRRLLQELPAMQSGLSFTERLLLEALHEHERSVSEVFALLTYERDPLPFATDFFLHATIERLRTVAMPLIAREPTANMWHDPLSITDAGRRVLAAEIDLLSLRPKARWVGGVEIRPDRRAWRWDDARGEVVR